MAKAKARAHTHTHTCSHTRARLQNQAIRFLTSCTVGRDVDARPLNNLLVSLYARTPGEEAEEKLVALIKQWSRVRACVCVCA